MARPRRAAHPDANQPGIVDDLRRLGFLVINLSRWIPWFDLLVWGWHLDTNYGFWTVWEVKAEGGKLTPAQQAFMDRWPGAVQEARLTEDILRAYGRAY